MCTLDIRKMGIRAPERFAIVAATAWIVGTMGPAMAQMSGQGAMPGMEMNAQQQQPTRAEPTMEMPDPMEQPIPDDGVARRHREQGRAAPRL